MLQNYNWSNQNRILNETISFLHPFYTFWKNLNFWTVCQRPVKVPVFLDSVSKTCQSTCIRPFLSNRQGNSVPQTDATTFALSSNSILLLYLPPSPHQELYRKCISKSEVMCLFQCIYFPYLYNVPPKEK